MNKLPANGGFFFVQGTMDQRKNRNRSRENDPISKSSSRTKKDKGIPIVFPILFWALLIVESVALAKRNYWIYTFTRSPLAALLLLMLVLSPQKRGMGAYGYLFFVACILGDIAIIFGGNLVAYLGLDGYTLSYFALAGLFQMSRKDKEEKEIGHIMMLLGSLALAVINLVFVYMPDQQSKLKFAQIALHGWSIFFLFASYLQYAKSNGKKYQSISLSLGLWGILLFNLLFAIDVGLLARRFAWMDGLVGFSNGLYMFLIAKGIASVKEKSNLVVKGIE